MRPAWVPSPPLASIVITVVPERLLTAAPDEEERLRQRNAPTLSTQPCTGRTNIRLHRCWAERCYFKRGRRVCRPEPHCPGR
mmetsp:Transcript_148452/g.413614  ORF Transcript_148452/g.413614 Transcript_148452/m.413614 type:complete len:82 (+) Transcript_148452:145-390(+)